MQGFHVDESRANRLAGTATNLYAQLKPASDSYVRYLNWSALLQPRTSVVPSASLAMLTWLTPDSPTSAM
mgnify:CR=1 FL=1